MGSIAHTPKIDKNWYSGQIHPVAYPKQKPEKVSVSAGISLPGDVKAQGAKLAESRGESLSSMVRRLIRLELQKAGYALEKSGKADLAKATSPVKKRR
jgi:hypothetical protein